MEGNLITRAVVQMRLEDASHFSDDQRKAIVESYPDHELDARTRGIPAMGSGRVYTVKESDITIEPFQIPPYWPQVIAMDFGWAHPTAFTKLAHDRDTDIIYVTSEYKKSEAIIDVHASAIKEWGNYPVAWPADVGAADRTTGKSFKEIWKKAGLRMLPDHAQFQDGGVSVEAGVAIILQRMKENKLKIFEPCKELLREITMYHRKEGIINKVNDDLVDAMRYGIMCMRFAKTGEKSRPLDYSAINVY